MVVVRPQVRSASAPHDLTCVVHLHSTYSDGTGTVPQIARAARRAGVDVVLLTDHDTLAAKRNGEERWYDDVLVLVGMEVTPRNQDHYLAFDVDQEVSPRLSGREICAAVREAGGFGFGAHPFSRGNERFRRMGYPFLEPDCLDGLELWSFLNDTGERLAGVGDFFRMILTPRRIIGGPPPANVEAWDRMGRERRVVAIGGLDAHQFGIRVAGHVPLRLMGYKRSFGLLRTHVLTDGAPSGELEQDRARVYEALRAGRCYIAVDAHADATGFAFWADAGADTDAAGPDPDTRSTRPTHRLEMGAECAFEPGWTIHARTPGPATIRLVRDGETIAQTRGQSLDHPIERAGVHRIEADLGERAWILSNPMYLR